MKVVVDPTTERRPASRQVVDRSWGARPDSDGPVASQHAEDVVAEVLARIHQHLGSVDDQGAVVTDLASCIRPLIDALPVDYRRALELTDLEGRTQAEAARLEGVSLSGMKSRVQRGRRLFAALVRNCCEVTTDSRGELVDFHLRPDGCGCNPACGAE